MVHIYRCVLLRRFEMYHLFRSRLPFKILHVFLGLVTHLIPICPSKLTPAENIASYRLWFLRFLVELDSSNQFVVRSKCGT